MAAPMITTDTSPASSMALCHRDRGGCGWRSPVFVRRERALAAAATHRELAHADKVADAERKARA